MRLLFLISSFICSVSSVAGGESPSANHQILELKQASPSVRYKAHKLDRSAGTRFLLFDIVHVVNPQSIPLAFTVHYQPPGQEKFYLGSFALYPADNPGRFIVPTQGKVGTEGEVLITLIPLEEKDGADAVQVKLREVSVIDNLDSTPAP